MMCDTRLFTAQTQALAERADISHASLAHDDTIAAAATRLLANRRKEAGGPLILIGLSMGGIVAMECIRQAPFEVAALVLMDTNPAAEPSERQALRAPQIERALHGGLESILIDEMKPRYLAPAHQQDDRILTLVLRMACDLGADVFARQSRALMHRADYRAVLADWRKPCLLLCGAYDTLCPPATHAAMQELMPQAAFSVINDAGHLPTLEAADAVNALLEPFVVSV